MAQLLYFVEGVSTLNKESAAKYGLGYALSDGCAHGAVNGKGPGGAPGVCACKSGEQLGYYPDKQTWLRIPRESGPGVFVGRWNDMPPTPQELERPKKLAGWPVRLLDGQDWIAATAYQWHEIPDEETIKWSHALPAHAEIDASGAWTRGRVYRDYERLWHIAKTHFDLLVGDDSGGDIELSAADSRDLAAEVLGVNYRVSKWECALLGLFDDPPTKAVEILRATVGLPAIEAWQKKRTRSAPGALSGSDGERA